MITLTQEQIEDSDRMAASADLPNFSLPGTGKTLATLEAFKKTGLEQLIVLCPPIAVRMWVETATSWLGMDAQALRKGTDTALLDTNCLVTTFDLASSVRPQLDNFARRGKTALVNDESQYLKTHDSKRTKAVFGAACDLRGSLAELCHQVWNLSGTPITSYANDMFTQAAVLHPEIFEGVNAETYAKFERLFTFKKQKQYSASMMPKWVVAGNQNELLLNRLVYKDLGAIRRKDAASLPPLVELPLTVSIVLNKELRAYMKHLTMAQIVEKLNSGDEMMAKALHAIGLAKVDQAVPYVGECAKVKPVLLGVWHRDVSSAYCERLTAMGLKAVEVNGSTPAKQKETIQDLFNAGAIDVLIGQMAAMGVSWNIQAACNHVILAEAHPSPSVVEQFYKRVRRYGQKFPVQLDHIYADMEIDTAIRELRAKKQQGSNRVHGE
jgi:hypothetical protein